MARRRVPPRQPRPGPATPGSPGPVDGRGPTGSYAGRYPEPALAKAGGGWRLDRAAQGAGRPPGAQRIGGVDTVAATPGRRPPASSSYHRGWPGLGRGPGQDTGQPVGAGRCAGPGWPAGAARHWPPDGGRQRRCGCGRSRCVAASIGAPRPGTVCRFKN